MCVVGGQQAAQRASAINAIDGAANAPGCYSRCSCRSQQSPLSLELVALLIVSGQPIERGREPSFIANISVNTVCYSQQLAQPAHNAKFQVKHSASSGCSASHTHLKLNHQAHSSRAACAVAPEASGGGSDVTQPPVASRAVRDGHGHIRRLRAQPQVRCEADDVMLVPSTSRHARCSCCQRTFACRPTAAAPPHVFMLPAPCPACHVAGAWRRPSCSLVRMR